MITEAQDAGQELRLQINVSPVCRSGRRYPCQYLKIDGDFSKTLPTSSVDQVFARSMVELAKGLGKATIAEFVEDEETLVLLKSLGVDYAQGFHIGRPAPLLQPSSPQVA